MSCQKGDIVNIWDTQCTKPSLEEEEGEFKGQNNYCRLEHLAACFAIEVCAYSVMSNHLHVVLRTRPDWVDSWTNEEIARQWLKVFPRKDDEGRPLPPDEREVRSLEISDTHFYLFKNIPIDSVY